MSNISITTIGELMEFQRGYDLPQSEFKIGKIPVISSNGILGYHNEAKAKAPGITIGRSGTVGLPHFINEDFFPHNTSLFIKDFKGNNPKYIFYLLKTLSLKDKGSGSGVPTMNRNHLHPLKVSAHLNITAQQKIADVLSALDEKIEINNKINAELEAMAKTIYNYWFVQFDFPNEEGKPYKSSGGKMVWNNELKREIPKGWEVKKLGEVLKIVRGASPRPINDYLSDNGTPWVKISDATLSKSRFIINTKQFIKNEGKEKSRIVYPNTLILSNSATPGLPKLMKIDACVHDGWLIVENYSLGFNPDFMFNYFEYERPRILSLGVGSIFKNLKTDYIKEIDMLIPPINILEIISNKLRIINDKIYICELQNQKLSELRDWLLPMLMNGQVSVR